MSFKELRETYTWYIIKCLDPDGYKLNHRWIKGPFNPLNYAINSYHLPPEKNLEFSFPVTVKNFDYLPVPPEIRSLINLIDPVRFDLIINLQSNNMGRVFLNTVDSSSELCRKLYSLADKFAFSLSHKSEKLFPHHSSSGETLETYGKIRWGAFGIVTEAPGIIDIFLSDSREMSSLNSGELKSMETEIYEEIHTYVSHCYMKIRDSISEKNPFLAFLESYRDYEPPHTGDDVSHPAAEDVLKRTVIERFRHLNAMGVLKRALEYELNKEKSLFFEELLAETEEKLLPEVKKNISQVDYKVLPLNKILAFYLYSIFYSADYVRSIYRNDIIKKASVKEFLSPVSLCRINKAGCAGCCIDFEDNEELLKDYIKENTDLFKEHFRNKEIITFSEIEDYILFRYRINKKHSPDFLKDNCLFTGYTEECNVGCLIHPYRMKGVELREFNLINCSPHEQCYRDTLWENLPEEGKKDFLLSVKHDSFLEYSKTLYSLIPELFVRYNLKNDLRENSFFREIIRDQNFKNRRDIKKNLLLLDQFVSSGEYIDYSFESLEKIFFNYGELFLERILINIAKEGVAEILLQKIPEEKRKKTDTFINGIKNYIIFCSSHISSHKTIIVSTAYDDPENKFSNNKKNTSMTVAFMIMLMRKIISLKNKKVNYLFLFSGADNDGAYPLEGSFYFAECLAEGLEISGRKIFPRHILCQLHFIDILQSDFYGKFVSHIPVCRDFPSGLEKYILGSLYKDPENIDFFLLSPEVTGDYIAKLIDRGKLYELLKDIEMTDEIINSIKKSTVFKEENMKEGLSHIFRKKGSTADFEKVFSFLMGVIDFLEIPENFNELKYAIIKKGIVKEKNGEIFPFYIKTEEKYTDRLSAFLSAQGFNMEECRKGMQTGIYPLACMNIPSVCLEGMEEKKSSLNKDLFEKGVIKFLRWLEKEKNQTRKASYIKEVKEKVAK